MDAYLDSIKKIYDSGHKQEAIEKLKSTLQSNPAMEDGWLLLATFFQKPENKTLCYKKVLAVNPNNATALFELNRIIHPEQELKLRLGEIPQSNPLTLSTNAPNQIQQTPVIVASVEPPPAPQNNFVKPIEENVPDQTKSSSGSDKLLKWLLISAVAFAGIIVIMLGILALSRNSQSNNETKQNVQEFLREAELLNTMTAQGVTINDFRNQLARVKSSYYSAAGGLAENYENENYGFQKAIEGWDLSLATWNAKVNYDFVTPELDQAAMNYLDTSVFTVSDAWLTELLYEASTYYEAARDSINYKME